MSQENSFAFANFETMFEKSLVDFSAWRGIVPLVKVPMMSKSICSLTIRQFQKVNVCFI